MILIVDLYGKPTLCRLITTHPAGTMDVERISDGQCFRVSGLPIKKEEES